jgi:hypothetical protein
VPDPLHLTDRKHANGPLATFGVRSRASRAGPEGGALPGLSCAALGCAEGALQGRPSPFEHTGLSARSLARADARTHAFRTLTIVANGSQSDIHGRIRFMRRGSHAVERVA